VATRPAGTSPPGPVVALALFPNGDLLAGVGPIGDPETGLSHQLYRGRADGWQRLDWPEDAMVRALRITPDGEAIFAVPRSNALLGAGQPWGLMRSRDGGRSWQQVLNGLGDPYVMDLALSPAFQSDRTLAAVTWYNGVFASTDGGDSWQSMSYRTAIEPGGGANPHDLAVALSPDFRGLERGTVCASFGHRLNVWPAAGQAWHTVSITVTARSEAIEPVEAPLTAGAIGFSPAFTSDGTIYVYSGYAGLLRSTDSGRTWSLAGRGLPAPSPPTLSFQMAVVATAEVYLLLPGRRSDATAPASEAADTASVLYRTRDGGRTWQALRQPLPPGGVSAFAVSRTDQGGLMLHLGGVAGGVSSYPADDLIWE
jgi:photosystem II stability/assembly factor-like uncharacterized protein